MSHENHEHHVSSAQQLWSIGGALIVLTIVTVGLAQFHFPFPWNIIVAMTVAIGKASLVVLFFMNLYWDKKLNSIVFIASLVFLAIMVGITLSDTLFREVYVPSF